MCFLEFLARNALFRVINNYILALKYHFVRYNWRVESLEAVLVKKVLRGLQYSVSSKPRPKGLFALSQIQEISQVCESFESLMTYRAAYLLALCGLFCISNIAPARSKFFVKSQYLLRSDIIFAYPVVHVRVK